MLWPFTVLDDGCDLEGGHLATTQWCVIWCIFDLWIYNLFLRIFCTTCLNAKKRRSDKLGGREQAQRGLLLLDHGLEYGYEQRDSCACRRPRGMLSGKLGSGWICVGVLVMIEHVA